MDEQVLANALEQSIQWLTEGRTVADCLQAFPELADKLAPLLEVGIVVRRAQVRSPDVTAAQNRVRAMVQARQRRRAQVDSLSQLVAAIVVICFAALMLWQSPRIFVVLSQLRTTATSTASPTATPTASATVTATETGTDPETATSSMTPTITATQTTTATPTPTVTATPSTRAPSATNTSVPRQPTIQAQITRINPTPGNGNEQSPSRVPPPTSRPQPSPTGEPQSTEPLQVVTPEVQSTRSGQGSTEPTESPS